MEKISKVTVTLVNGQTKSFEGTGVIRLVDTGTKQDGDTKLNPMTYAEISLEVKK